MLALPLVAILVLDATPFEVGLLGAASSRRSSLVRAAGGGLDDRPRRRPILIAADVGWATLLASIPVAH